MDRNAQFTMELYVDADNKAVYVDSKAHQKVSNSLSFASFKDQVDHLRQLEQVTQVIVPKGGDLETLQFQTELKIRPNKLTVHEKLARRLTSLMTGVSSKDVFKGECGVANGERYQEALSVNRHFSESRLKHEIREREGSRKRLHSQLDRIAGNAVSESRAA